MMPRNGAEWPMLCSPYPTPTHMQSWRSVCMQRAVIRNGRKGRIRKDLIEAPLFCRDSDLYAISILDALPEMRNEVRDTTPKEEQNIIRKTKETILSGYD